MSAVVIAPPLVPPAVRASLAMAVELLEAVPADQRAALVVAVANVVNGCRSDWADLLLGHIDRKL